MSFGSPYLLAPLHSMLGIRPGMKVSVINAPQGFIEKLNPMPEGAELIPSAKTGLDVTIFFTQKKVELVEKLPALARGMSVMGGIWVVFPAQESPAAPNEDFVRLAALEVGLMDNKKLPLDPAWTGLRLVWRPRPRAEKPEARA